MVWVFKSKCQKGEKDGGKGGRKEGKKDSHGCKVIKYEHKKLQNNNNAM